MADTSELLRLCDDVIYATNSGEYTAMTNGEVGKVCEDAAPLLARALKSRLQAEAPEDAEVAAIRARWGDLENPDLQGYDTVHDALVQCRIDCHALLRARTSQAEAQAPTTAAQASADNPELDGTDYAHPAWWRGNDRGVDGAAEQVLKMFTEEHHSGMFNHEGLNTIRAKIHELRGVGAPAPAPTPAPEAHNGD